MPSPEETLMMKGIAAIAATIYAVRWFLKWLRKTPVIPDPWEAEIKPEELDAATPVCLNCLTPVKPHQHYCPVCNNVTGDFTRYLPFVNILFNNSIFGTLWRKLRDPDASHLGRLIAFIVVLFGAPIMLIVGLPWLLFSRRKTTKADGADPTAIASEPPTT